MNEDKEKQTDQRRAEHGLLGVLCIIVLVGAVLVWGNHHKNATHKNGVQSSQPVPESAPPSSRSS
jgi:hypothetical protein